MPRPRRRCIARHARVGVESHLRVAQSSVLAARQAAAHWQAEIVLLSGPTRCMVSGRMCDALALRLTSTLDPAGRSIILDLAVLSALVDSGLALLETGIGIATEEPESDSEG